MKQLIEQIPVVLRHFQETISQRKDHIACGRIYDDSLDTLTYAELGAQVEQFAAYLQTISTKSDRAVILAETHNEFVIAFYGCFMAGVTAVPCYTASRKRTDQLLNVIEDCDAKIMIGLEPTVRKFETVLPEYLHFVSVSEAEKGHLFEPVDIEEKDIAFLQYTSGTTSAPKGVMVSFENLLANLKMIKTSFLFNLDTVMVSWLPFYHDMGLIGMILSPIFSGGSTYYLAPTDFMARPIRWIRALSELKATSTGAPNFGFDHCYQRVNLDLCEGFDLSNLQTLFCGSEPIRYASLVDFHKKFSALNFNYNALYPCYGLAEVVLFATGGTMKNPFFNHAFNSTDLLQNKVTPVDASAEDAVQLVGCGFPTPELDGKVIIVDPETREPMTDGVGEIWISGTNVSHGYWNKEELSKEIFFTTLKDHDGNRYLRSGDLGFIYNNELFISGRLKNLIIISGRNLFPHDIELSVQNSYEGLGSGRCAVFSIIIDGREKLICIKELHRSFYRQFDEKQEGAEQLTKEVYRSIQKQVSGDIGILVHDIFFVNQGQLSVTTSGKLKIQAIKQQYLDGTLKGFSLSERAT